MKKIFLLLAFCLVSFFSAFATHNRSGTINYKHLSGLTYEVKIITYTKISGQSIQADRFELLLNWGDGSSLDIIPRVSTMLIDSDIQENIYTKTHTYPSAGNYLLSMQDINRNDGILNINAGNSINIPFYVEANLFIPNTGDFNTSVEFLTPPITNIEAGKPARFNLSAVDADGDFLTYELITPKADIDVNVPNYVLPSTASVSFLGGEFVWLTPQNIGEYNFAIKVNEYRNAILVGSTIFDCQVIVHAPVSQYAFIGNTSWQVDTNNLYSYTISPQDNLELILAYTDSTAVSTSLNTYGETFLGTSPATVIIDSVGTLFQRKKYTLNSNSLSPRCAPYIITFRGKSTNNLNILADITVMIFVRDASSAHCDALINQIRTPITQLPSRQKELAVTIFPNPFSYQTTIFIQTEEINSLIKLSLFDVLGNQVLSQQFYGRDCILNKNQLAAGVYIYKIENESGRLATGKIIIN